MRELAWTWIVVCVALFAAPSLAARPQSAVGRAEKAAASGDFGKALSILDEALAKSPSSGETVRIELMRGQMLVALGRSDEAEDAFAHALALDPKANVDQAAVGPAVAKVFKAARAKLKGVLAVQVKGGAAEILVDGEDMGPAPLKAQLGAGDHQVTATVDGETVVSKHVDVKPGTQTELQLELPRKAEPAARQEAQAPAPSHDTTTPPPAEGVSAAPSEPPSHTGAYIAGGVALAAAGAGAYFGLTALRLSNDARTAPQTEYVGVLGRAKSSALIADVCFAAALAGAGVAVWQLSSSSGSSEKVTVAPTVGGGALVVAQGSF